MGTYCRREWLWAEVVGDSNHARLMNVPLNREYGLGDIVEYDPVDHNHIINILMKGSRTVGGVYQSTGDKIYDRGARAGIKCYLERYAIHVEFITGRIFGMAVPLNMSDDKVCEITKRCPVPFDQFITPS